MLKGDKILLDFISYSDLEIILQWRNDQKIAQFFREYRLLNIENQKEWYSMLNKKDNIFEYFFLIRLSSDNEPIGVCGLNYINWINRTGQLSLYIGKNSLYIDSEGWAEEACKILEEYGFNKLNLNKIYCEIYDFDKKKIELLEKLNYKIEGRFEEHIFRNGNYYDSLFFGKLKKSQNEIL
ncbi:MAG: GNAT family N-acetyltransferase [Solirubrobacterales bacterium]